MDIPDSITDRYGPPPFFNDQPLYAGALRDPAERAEYVLWLDLMGMQNIMRVSLSRTANFAAKLVMAAEQSVRARPGLRVRPVIDGAFVHGTDLAEFRDAAREVYARLAMVCVKAAQPVERLIVRGGISHGAVVRGEDIPDSCYYRGNRPDRVAEVIFGPAVSDAYAMAEQAPPFGVSVAASAGDVLSDGGGSVATRQWRWWEAEGVPADRELAGYLRRCVEEYYAWCEERPVESGYSPDRLILHRALFREHYSGV